MSEIPRSTDNDGLLTTSEEIIEHFARILPKRRHPSVIVMSREVALGLPVTQAEIDSLMPDFERIAQEAQERLDQMR